MPSIPRSPKPPGTIMPSQSFSISGAVSRVIFSESIHWIFTLASLTMPPWCRASATDRYASCNATYLPTRPMVTSLSARFCRSVMAVHSVRSGSRFSRPRWWQTLSVRPSFSSIMGTSYRDGAVIFWIMSSSRTLQNMLIFRFISSGISSSVRQTTTWG